MSEEQVRAFIEKAKVNPSIQDSLRNAQTHEDVVAIAKEHGHDFTAETLQNTEVSEQELEAASGGSITTITFVAIITEKLC